MHLKDPQEESQTKHLHILIPMGMHKELRQRALDRNVTVSKYVIEAVMARVRSEKKYE